MRNNLKYKLNRLKPAQVLVGYYSLAIIISVILLSLPGVHKPGVSIPFIDTIFTAISAVSVTGLTVIDISASYSVFGIFMLMLIFQFGGIGVMALGTFFWLLLRRKIGLKSRKLIMADHNQTSLAGLVALIKDILFIILGIELIGALVLGLYFLNYFPDWKTAFLNGLFVSVSATTNAGFALAENSLIPFVGDYFVQLICMILITLGAIGFPVLQELKQFLSHKEGAYPVRFSLFTKLTTFTFIGLLIFGTIMILLLEWRNAFAGESWHKSFFYALFQTVSTRSAGLATINVNEFTEPTLLVMSMLMFIGASPSSVGGGIRTTTFAINILFLYHFAKGKKHIKVFNRELHDEDITKSFAITFMAAGLCGISIIILSITETHSLMEIVFEICSAFGTTGFSMGITADLSIVGKCVIMILMFIGRIGLTSFLFIIGGKEQQESYHYPKERVIIG